MLALWSFGVFSGLIVAESICIPPITTPYHELESQAISKFFQTACIKIPCRSPCCHMENFLQEHNLLAAFPFVPTLGTAYLDENVRVSPRLDQLSTRGAISEVVFFVRRPRICAKSERTLDVRYRYITAAASTTFVNLENYKNRAKIMRYTSVGS